MEQKPRTGYLIDIDPDHLEKEQETFRLSVRFSAPEKGAVVARMTTNPCLIFSIRRDGRREIVAGDTGLSYLL
jgi:hypothetical protein